MAQQTFEEIAAAVKQAESGGKRYKDDGKTLTTSAKGALGEMQVMPKTVRDPGYGVVPARDKSPDEIARVGRDYLQAMLGKYGDMDKALAAYNWGPGSTDKWIAAGAKLEKLPEETRTYIQRVKGFLEDKPVTASVSRETPAPRKALPPSLPPMAAAPALDMKQQVASLGPGYQAALALSFLSDTDDKEDRDTEREPGIAEQFMAQTAARPSAFAEFADFKIRSPFAAPQPPVRMAGGGEAVKEQRFPEKSYPLSKESSSKIMLKNILERTRQEVLDGYSPFRIHGRQIDLAYKAYKSATGTQPLEDLLEQAQRANRGADIIGGAEPGSMKPVERANGSPEEGEQAASDPKEDQLLAMVDQMPAPAARVVLQDLAQGPRAIVSPRVMESLAKRAAMQMGSARQQMFALSREPRYSVEGGGTGQAASLYGSADIPVGDASSLRLGAGGYRVDVPGYKDSGLTSTDIGFRTPFMGGNFSAGVSRDMQRGVNAGSVGYARKFDKGGEAKKSSVVDDIGKWLAKNDINPSDFLTALGRVGTAAGAALTPSTLNEGEAEELARRRKLPPTVDRANGSPVTGEQALTQEEIDAASRPAFITPSSGRGRKQGPISKALASGEGYVEFAKGLTNLPQNLVGAPMDISNMIANAFGGGVEKPIGGSEYIKEALRKRGLGFTPSTDPTLAGFYAAGDLGSNLVNPAGAARAGVKAAGKTGEAAKMLARDFQQYNQQLAVPGASYAVRNKGTPFMMGYERTAGPDGVLPAIDQAAKYIKQDVAVTGDPKLNDWLSNKLTSYLRRDFATPDDQFVKAADANQLLHFVNKPIPKRPDLDPYYERIADSSYIGSLPYVRQKEGFEAKGEAKTEYGKRAETLTDASAWPLQLEDITSPGLIPPGMRDMVKTDPSARLTELGSMIDEMLQFDKLAGDMERMRSMPKTYSAYSQPGIKVPEEYLLTDEMLIGLTPAQASNRVARFRNWEEENRQRMASKAFFEDPTIDRTLAEGGGVWVNPGNLEERPSLLKLVQDVGCDGGWCTREEATALSYGSGENRLSILMDSKARPQAQLTITSKQYGADEFIESMADSEAIAFQAKYPNIASYNTNAIMSTPEFQQFKGMNPDTYSITEIKGTNNRTDFENTPYLKQIQQQIKDLDAKFNLQGVDNLSGIGMSEIPENPMNLLRVGVGFGARSPLEKTFGTEMLGLGAVRNEAIRLNGGSKYIVGDREEINLLLGQAVKNVLTPPQRATGGMVERQFTDNRRYM